MSLFCPYCNSEALMQGQTALMPGQTTEGVTRGNVSTEFLCSDCEKLSLLDGGNPERVLIRHPKEEK